jgi:endonuclease YncB( thermonuclease family)
MKPTQRSFTLLYILLILIVCLSTNSCLTQQSADQYTDTLPTSTTAFTPPSFHAKVTRVLDGDTIEVLTQENSTLRIRLQGIDAPEKTQAFGDTAQQQLTALILNKEVSIESDKKDNYGRLIGKVTRNITTIFASG